MKVWGPFALLANFLMALMFTGILSKGFGYDSHYVRFLCVVKRVVVFPYSWRQLYGRHRLSCYPHRYTFGSLGETMAIERVQNILDMLSVVVDCSNRFVQNPAAFLT